MRTHESGDEGMAVARPAFTLIELLVVISLIALLMGILLPLLGKSRRVGLAGACLSNQRQLMVALESFTIENKGLFPNRLPETPAGAQYAQLDPMIVLAQNGEDSDYITLPDLPPARPSSWAAACSTQLRSISMAYTANKQDNARFVSRPEAPEFVCPADEDPSGPFFGQWMPDEAIDRSYVFNGFNDFRVQNRADWNNINDRSAVPRDLIVAPSDTTTFGEKKSGTSFAYRFYVDIFRETNPVDVLVQDRHDSGGTNTFADGSARLMEPFASSSPVNLWGLNTPVRKQYTYAADRQ